MTKPRYIISLMVIAFIAMCLLNCDRSLDAQTADITLRQRAQFYFLDGNLSQAAELYARLADANPDWIIAYNAGYLFLETGRLEQAERYLVKARELKAKSPWIACQLGNLYLAKGDTAQGIEYLKEAAKVGNKERTILTSCADALGAARRYAEAEDYALAAVKYGGDWMESRLCLARLYAATSRERLAMQQVDEALKTFPNGETLYLGFQIAGNLGDTARVGEFRQLYNRMYPGGSHWEEMCEGMTEPEITVCGPDELQRLGAWMDFGMRYTYDGRWGLIPIGDLTVEVHQPLRLQQGNSIPISYRVKSLPLPFIHIDDFYIGYLCPTLTRSLKYRMKARETWWKYDGALKFDYTGRILEDFLIDEDGRIGIQRWELPDTVLDGTSVLFAARRLVRDRESGRAATYVDQYFSWTDVKYQGKKEKIELKVGDQEAWVIDAHADYTGVGGMSGDFTGWFSADGKALPLKARMGIFIGSITLSLSKVEKLDSDDAQFDIDLN